MRNRYIFLRAPNGRFLMQQEAITVWLPVFLNWCWSRPIEQALTVLIGQCSSEASKRLEFQAKQVCHGHEPVYRAVDRWLKMREILTRARAEIKAVWDA